MMQQLANPDVSDGDFQQRLKRALDSRQVLASTRNALRRSQHSSSSVADCALTRLHFGGGIGPVAEYDMTFDAGGRCTSRRMFIQVPHDDPGKAFSTAATKVRRRLVESGVLQFPQDQLIHLEEIGAILRPEGVDERVDGLWLLAPNTDPSKLEAGNATADWDEIVELGRVDVRTQLLAHRLGKRAVLHLSAGQQEGGDVHPFILKFYKRSMTKLAAIASWQALLARSFGALKDVRVPRVLAVFDRSAGIATEFVDGSILADLAGRDAVANYGLGGKALAHLHKARLKAPFHTAGDEQALLNDIVTRVLDVDATFKGDFARAMAAVNRRREQCQPFLPSVIHRDFHEKQIICDGNRAWLIDFDMLAKGDPAQDLANFVAHVALRQIQTGEQMADNVASFIDGYTRHGRRCAIENLEFHLAATFTRLAAISMFSDRWRHLVPGLLQQAIDGAKPFSLSRLGRNMQTRSAFLFRG
jgi:Ser/Thr protein kinase RdoA (MazF antagonist)